MKALILSTVAKSLAFQAPSMWPILRGRGLDLTFAAADDGYASRLAAHGTFQSVRLSRSAGLDAARGVRDVARLARQDWDLVQVQTPIAGLAYRSVQADPDKFPVYVAHGLHCTTDLPGRKARGFQVAESVLTRRSKAIALVSGEDFELAQRLGWGEHALIWHLPGAGVDTKRFQGAAHTSDRNGPFALFVGELNHNKQIAFAVNVAAALIDKGRISKFVVVGEGPLSGVLDKGIRDGWIEHHPFREDIPEVMASASVLLHTSIREGLPRVLIEAQAAGLPVLARSNRGSRELVVEGTGRLLPRDASVRDWLVAFEELDVSRAMMWVNAVKYDITTFEESYRALLSAVESGMLCGYGGPQ